MKTRYKIDYGEGVYSTIDIVSKTMPEILESNGWPSFVVGLRADEVVLNFSGDELLLDEIVEDEDLEQTKRGDKTMIKLDVKEKLLRAQQYQAQGEDQKAVDVIREIFEPLIRRDNDELEVDDLFDLIAVAAYSAERANQLFELVEKELEKRAPEDQKDIRENIAFMRGCAMCFL